MSVLRDRPPQQKRWEKNEYQEITVCRYPKIECKKTKTIFYKNNNYNNKKEKKKENNPPYGIDPQIACNASLSDEESLTEIVN